MIQHPDPFCPERMITIQDPEWILAAHQDHVLCPICARIRDDLTRQAEDQNRFMTGFRLLHPDETLPLKETA